MHAHSADAHLDPARLLMPQQQQPATNTTSASTTAPTQHSATASGLTGVLSLTPAHRCALLSFLEAATAPAPAATSPFISSGAAGVLGLHHGLGRVAAPDLGSGMAAAAAAAAASNSAVLAAPQLLPLLQLRCLAQEPDVRAAAARMVGGRNIWRSRVVLNATGWTDGP